MDTPIKDQATIDKINKHFNESLLKKIQDDYYEYLQSNIKGKKRSFLSWCQQQDINIQAIKDRIRVIKLRNGEICEEKTTAIYDLFTVTFKQDTAEPFILNIVAKNERKETVHIGSFNFLNKIGYIKLLDGSIKEYKRWSPLMQNFWRMDNHFGSSNKNLNINSILNVPYKCQEAVQQYKQK